MRRRRADGPVHVGVRAALSLLVAVVALLCVIGQAQRGGSPARPSGTEATRLSTDAFPRSTPAAPAEARASAEAPASAEARSDAAAPCGKKAVADQATPRHDGPPRLPDCTSCSDGWSPAAAFHASCGRDGPVGPAPPPAPPLHFVLRI